MDSCHVALKFSSIDNLKLVVGLQTPTKGLRDNESSICAKNGRNF